MARPLRIEYPGAFYHVINRGLERREIYRKESDKEYFLELLERVHEKYGLWVHSYCLMPNHYHLYLETPNGGLSKAMRQLDGNFTQKFNKRHNRVGPLFQGRYKAALIDQDSYSLQLLKYIHLNPVKAKITEKPEDYKWSSYAAYLGKVKVPEFLKTDWLLGQFNKSKNKARKALRQFTMQAEEETDWSPEKEAYKGIILGDSDFVTQIQNAYLLNKEDSEIPTLKVVQKQISPEQIEQAIKRFKLPDNISNKVIIYALKQYSPMSLKEIGECAGLHYSSISQIVIRLKKQAKTDKQLEKLLHKVDVIFKMSNVKT